MPFAGHFAVRPASSPCSPLVVLFADEGEGEAVAQALDACGAPDHTLAAVSVPDWNADLSPWKTERICKQGGDFAGGADAFLADVTRDLLPRLAADYALSPAFTAAAGYSLAGLFAVYALWRTAAFSRVCSASGSFWFPGFADFVKTHAPVRLPDRLYLSLGDKEAQTRHPVMRTVADGTREVETFFREKGVPVTFEWNEGGHFRDAPQRLAKGIAAILADQGGRI